MIIPETVQIAMIAHARREAPIEACGYLVGAEGLVHEAHAMTNADAREDHFSFVPEEQFAAFKKVRQADLQIVGVYHSHPATAARPSAEDVRLAYDPGLLYVIISLEGREATVKGFRIRQGTVEEEPLTDANAEEKR